MRVVVITGKPMGLRSEPAMRVRRLMRLAKLNCTITNKYGEALEAQLRDIPQPIVLICFGRRACIKMSPWKRIHKFPEIGSSVDVTFNPPHFGSMSGVYCCHLYFHGIPIQTIDPMEYSWLCSADKQKLIELFSWAKDRSTQWKKKGTDGTRKFQRSKSGAKRPRR